MQVWLNGQFIDRDMAQVSVFDAGFQHGVGLFETMSAVNGRVFRPEAHIQRLAESAKQLLLSERLRTEPLVEAVQHAIDHNNMAEARLRLTITGGNLNMLQSEGQSNVDPTVLIVPQPPTPYPDVFFEKGVTVMIADGRLNPFQPMAGHKTMNYWPNIRALQIAGSHNASEALWFTVSNHLACGSVSNVFLVKDEVLLTPIARGEEVSGSVPSAVRPGVTREAVIEIAKRRNVEVQTKMLDIEQLLAADEVFLTNSSWGVLPMTQVERETIGDGAVGEITSLMREGWLELRERETTVTT